MGKRGSNIFLGMQNRRRSIFCHALLIFCVLGILASPLEANATSKPKIFILTSTYGVMTGTLAGLATLAFVGSPGQHGRFVAMGASLGLYAGILLGAYIVYMVPDPKKVKERRDRDKEKSSEQQQKQIEDNPLGLDPKATGALLEIPRLIPLLYADEKGRPQVGVSFSF